jgi:cell division protein FtsB
LTPEQLNTVIASREEKAKIAAGETNPGQLIAELRQENAQLKADNAMLKEQLAAAKKLPDPAKVEPPKPTWPKQDVPNRSKPGHDDK